MATKKEKRQAALAKRESFLAEERSRGLAAQKQDRERREKELARIKAEVEEVNRKHRTIIAAALIASGAHL